MRFLCDLWGIPVTDLFEPLRQKLRERGWRLVQRWQQWYWQRPEDGALFDEEEAFWQLERLQNETKE
jgi:hypothetical protein